MRVAKNPRGPKPRGFDPTALSQVSWMQVTCPRDPEPTFKLAPFKPRTLWLVPKVVQEQAPEVLDIQPVAKRKEPKPEYDRSHWVTRAMIDKFLQGQKEPLSTRQIAQHFNCSRKAVASTLQFFIKEGYVTCEAKMIGGRANHVYTRTGKVLIEEESCTAKILAFLKENQGATASELTKIIDRPRLGGFMGNLKSRGLVTSTRKGNVTKYYLPE